MYNSIVLTESMWVRTPVWFSQKILIWKTDLSLHFGRGGLGRDVLGANQSKRKKTENIGRQQEITSQYFSISYSNSDKTNSMWEAMIVYILNRHSIKESVRICHMNILKFLPTKVKILYNPIKFRNIDLHSAISTLLDIKRFYKGIKFHCFY